MPRAIGSARGDVDDLAVAGADHVRRDMLHHEKRAAPVDRHHAVPQLDIYLPGLGGLEGREQRGVVHQHVDPAAASDHLLHEARHLCLVAHVEGRGKGAAGAALAVDRFGQRRSVDDVGDRNRRALGRERLRTDPACPPGAAGDGHHPAGQPSHASPPCAGSRNVPAGIARNREPPGRTHPRRAPGPISAERSRRLRGTAPGALVTAPPRRAAAVSGERPAPPIRDILDRPEPRPGPAGETACERRKP